MVIYCSLCVWNCVGHKLKKSHKLICYNIFLHYIGSKNALKMKKTLLLVTLPCFYIITTY